MKKKWLYFFINKEIIVKYEVRTKKKQQGAL